MHTTDDFPYMEAFSRNLGWFTEEEQLILRNKRVAIAGLGGVGGSHLLALARTGIGGFTISDFDKFEYANFNRQAGAGISTIGRPKIDVMAEKLRDLNPTVDLRLFADGISEDDIDAFLNGVDIYIDSIDFFVLDLRSKIFARCKEKGIPAITAAPVGMGAAYIVFTPEGMGFEQYFRFKGVSDLDQQVSFLAGLTPKKIQRSYLMDYSRVDFLSHRLPSTGLACDICAGVAAAEAIKLLLGRGKTYPAPWFHHFDAYLGKWVRRYMPWGNANPIQKLRIYLTKKIILGLAGDGIPRQENFPREIEKILDRARWAPSGDNTQPWRFHIRDDDHVDIIVTTENQDIYDQLLTLTSRQ